MVKLIKSGSAGGELERMRREMERIWDRFSSELSTSTLEMDWNPPLDLMEIPASLVAELEVPGINPDEINISVTPDLLTVTGEKKQESGGQEKNYHVRERTYGRFTRSIPLPTSVSPDRVEARYKDGILTITMGKSKAVQSKRIEVQTA
jgi:HSP20 family protein